MAFCRNFQMYTSYRQPEVTQVSTPCNFAKVFFLDEAGELCVTSLGYKNRVQLGELSFFLNELHIFVLGK